MAKAGQKRRSSFRRALARALLGRGGCGSECGTELGAGMGVMLGYHFFIAWKSLRRTPWHTLLIIAGVALGVSVATLFSAIYHAYAQDPIPKKSSALHYVRMDSWDPQQAYYDGIPPHITYRDMSGITKSNIPVRQTATYQARLRISDGTGKGPARVDAVRLCHADFFTMFEIPFRYGSGWSREADEKEEHFVVLGDELNQRYFGGKNSVGRTVRIDERDFQVVGVLAHFRPSVKYYDITTYPTLPPERLFISMSHVKPMEIRPTGESMSWGIAKPGVEGWLNGERTFLQMWVELSSPQDVAAYKSFLDSYAMDQRQVGRFLRPLDNRVTPMREYMKEKNCPPPAATAMMITADLFLVACAISLMGLLLARFFARAAEIGVRRALGARQWDVFVQHFIESELMALAGGLLGLALAVVLVWLANRFCATNIRGNRDDLFRMDMAMAVFGVAASLIAGLIAGVYPAYRVCRIAPASHLKIQ
jgi:putative ABC transport system permease protein